MNTSTPTISIIVTTYNVDKYIEQCLNSVCEQTLKEIEIIVVDDGSTDKTANIIEHFANSFDAVVPILLEKNTVGGVATPANIGLKRAKGKYVGFVDGDDYIAPDMFEKLVNAAETHNSTLAMCGFFRLDEDTLQSEEADEERHWGQFLGNPVVNLDRTNTLAALRFNAVPWRKIYLRSHLEKNNIAYPEGDFFYEDNPFHWFNLIKAESLALVQEPLCWHRMNRSGQTMSTVDNRTLKIFKHFYIIDRWLQDENLQEQYRLMLLRWVLIQYTWISKGLSHEYQNELYENLSGILEFYKPQDLRALVDQDLLGGEAIVAAELVMSGAKDEFIVLNEGRRQKLNSANNVKRRLHVPSPAPPLDSWSDSIAGIRERLSRKLRKRKKKVSNEELFYMISLLDRKILNLTKELEKEKRRSAVSDS
ncbi:MAG: glycosyltransferase family 2 protein [Paracoccaceae bacterium]